MTATKDTARLILLHTPIGRALLAPFRLRTALSYCMPQVTQALWWTLASRELSNFTYDLTTANVGYLAHTISVVTKCPYRTALGYLKEIQEDNDVKEYIRSRVRK